MAAGPTGCGGSSSAAVAAQRATGAGDRDTACVPANEGVRASSVRDRRVVRVLLASSMVRSAGRGIFMSVLTVHMIRFLGATAPQAGLVITLGSLAGVIGAYGFGRLSDRIPARGILVALALVECVSFLGFAWSPTYLTVVPFAMLFGPANLGSGAVRSVVIVRDFQGEERVALRARTYLTMNLGIGAGASLGAIALISDDPMVPRIVLMSAAMLYLVAAGISWHLPGNAGHRDAPESSSATNDPRSKPSRDRRFLALVALTTVFGTHIALLEVAMPLWITLHTQVPRYLVTVLLVFNTALVLVLQMPIARRCVSAWQAGKWAAFGGLALTVGNVSMWAAHGRGSALAVTALVFAVIALTLGEVAVLTSTWTLSFDLTPADGAGAYQGLFTFGWQSGVMLGPVVVTTVAVTHGLDGWLGVSAPLLLAGILFRVLASRLSRVAPER
ncbi:putative MFS family arabinose efflux permease [Kribbella sp. VKM Ac-2571]|uniref:MFS transporter n=1 Tax=Kribbella sp. VKM Ac-2571 TaxID=2512222 RepID=UPI00105CDC13|nr:MFS transporter [Kribbella sp. VKM Ac-2571]TDO56644.1 putative MFS family arabinose efflux permease [Kribbella sp. VKM Ac-2571]